MSEPRLIHANGALDHDAIATEINRRMVGRKNWQFDIIEAKVRDAASRQRWPFVERAIAAEWTEAEHAEYWRLQDAKHATAISMVGLAEWDRITLMQAAIEDEVTARAKARVDAPAMQHAAE